METGWIMDMFRGAGKLLIHPLFYYSFLLALLVGYRRVKRERKDFKIRIESGYFEMKNMLPLGLLIGIVLSIVFGEIYFPFFILAIFSLEYSEGYGFVPVTIS